MTSLYDKARQSLWLAWLLDNPLLVREIRRRMRGKLFSWSLIAYVLALGGVSCVIMFGSYPAVSMAHVSLREMSQQVGKIGETLYWGMCFVEGFIALFIAPMLTAGLATQEKEKDTFDFLRVTTLHARTFVSGCLLTTASFLLLIFSCTLPILGLTFIFGGVSMAQILSFNVLIFLAAMAISAWGVFNSTSYQRSRAVHGSLVVILFIAFYFGQRIATLFTTRIMAPFSSAVGGTWLDAVSTVAPFILAIAVLSIAAARRLYEPNNRLFNYTQYSICVAVILGSVGGTLVYRMSSFSYAPLAAAQVTGYLSVYFFAGLILLILAILIFSTGRIEKGDEVWNVRHTVPFFRIIHEQYLLYAAYVGLWFLPAYWMGASYDPAKFLPRLELAIPVSLAAIFFAVAATRCMNYFWEGRNRTMIAAFLILILVWGVAPAGGYFLNELAGGKKAAGPLSMMGEFLFSLSPAPVLADIWSDAATMDDAVWPAIFQIILGLMFLSPMLKKDFRSRVSISYDWWSSIGEQPSVVEPPQQ
ncbi:hypothetical protein HY256_03655 [Candidatus Sumerlaeota bacterium]|nr:hypothetical protein [Candidatus Sumerlaeota bacterium]